MFELAGVTFTYGESKRAYLNPVTLLHRYSDLLNVMQGIIFVSSENGVTINLVVTNSFLPGGYRNNNNGTFNNMSNNGNLWSSTENNSNNAWNRKLNYNNTNVNRNNNNKRYGISVRCVRDLEFNIISLFTLTCWN